MDHLIPDFVTIMISNVFSVQDSKYLCICRIIKLMRKKCISNMDTIKIQFYIWQRKS